MIMFYMMPRRMVLKKHEIQEFRGIAEGLVGESGIDPLNSFQLIG